MLQSKHGVSVCLSDILLIQPLYFGLRFDDFRNNIFFLISSTDKHDRKLLVCKVYAYYVFYPCSLVFVFFSLLIFNVILLFPRKFCSPGFSEDFHFLTIQSVIQKTITPHLELFAFRFEIIKLVLIGTENFNEN